MIETKTRPAKLATGSDSAAKTDPMAEFAAAVEALARPVLPSNPGEPPPVEGGQEALAERLDVLLALLGRIGIADPFVDWRPGFDQTTGRRAEAALARLRGDLDDTATRLVDAVRRFALVAKSPAVVVVVDLPPPAVESLTGGDLPQTMRVLFVHRLPGDDPLRSIILANEFYRHDGFPVLILGEPNRATYLTSAVIALTAKARCSQLARLKEIDDERDRRAAEEQRRLDAARTANPALRIAALERRVEELAGVAK